MQIISGHKNPLELALLIAFGAIIFSWPALFNGFPLVFSDTGAYIWAGFAHEMPLDRPFLYGWFLRHSSLEESFWFSVLIQSWLLSSAVWLFIKHFAKRQRAKLFSITSFLLAFTTCAGINSSFLMPDVFTPLLAIHLYLLIFARAGKLLTGYSLTVVVFACLVHTSHAPIALGVMLIAVIGPFRRTISTKAYSLVFAALILSFPLSILVNGIAHNHWGTAGGTPQFLVAKLDEEGILQPFLEEHCADEHLALCDYQSQFDWHYLWGPESPLYKIGGWQNAGEHWHTIKSLITYRSYAWQTLQMLGSSTAQQMFKFRPKLFQPANELLSPKVNLKLYLPKDYSRLMRGKQMHDNLFIPWIQAVQYFVVAMSFLLMVLGLIFLDLPKPQKAKLQLALAFLFCNAVICGGLSSIVDRYQARIVWILPLVVIVLLHENRTNFRHLLGQKR